MRYANVSNAEEYTGPTPLEEGSYILRVDEVRDAGKDNNALTDRNGDPYVWVVFRVDGHDNKVWHMIYPDPDPQKSSYGPRSSELKSFLEAIECPTEGGDTADWVGRKCRAYLIIGEWENKKRNEVKFFEGLENAEEKKESFKNDDDDLPF